jgi:hypothetical protein
MKKRQYMLLLGAVVLAAVYILSTEVMSRWIETLRAYDELKVRESLIAAPESLAVRRAQLRRKEALLRQELAEAAGDYSRSFSGFLSLASKEATSSRVTLTGASPLAVPQDEKRTREERFRLQIKGEFHTVALYVNRLENGPLEIQCNRMVLKRSSGPGMRLGATLEGSFPSGE